jgi:hypothetical protein
MRPRRGVIAGSGYNSARGATLSVLWRTGAWYNVLIEAFAIPDARDRVNEAVDALVDESIDIT